MISSDPGDTFEGPEDSSSCIGFKKELGQAPGRVDFLGWADLVHEMN
jgi:hypothetical protein